MAGRRNADGPMRLVAIARKFCKDLPAVVADLHDRAPDFNLQAAGLTADEGHFVLFARPGRLKDDGHEWLFLDGLPAQPCLPSEWHARNRAS